MEPDRESQTTGARSRAPTVKLSIQMHLVTVPDESTYTFSSDKDLYTQIIQIFKTKLLASYTTNLPKQSINIPSQI